MGAWDEILDEVKGLELERNRESIFDETRRKYLKSLSQHTGRNVVAYYSSWLQKPGLDVNSINDSDKNGFMACFKGLDPDKGLDLILHSPGGDVAATESIIDYIRAIFGSDVRTIIPQISMSGGTMIACCGSSIVMGKHSNLGPVDPQFSFMPARALLDEFELAKQEIAEDQSRALVWQPILAKYPPALLVQARHAIAWSEQITVNSLSTGMFSGEEDCKDKAKKVAHFLLEQEVHKAHGRHIHRKDLKDIGLNIVDLEDDQTLQDIVLSIHHAFMISFDNTPAVKMVENHEGRAMIRSIRTNQSIGPAEPINVETPGALDQGRDTKRGLLARLFSK